MKIQLHSVPLPGLLLGTLCLFVLLAWAFAPQDSLTTDNGPADFSTATAFDVVANGNTVHLLFAQTSEGSNLQDGKPSLFYTRSADAGETWSHPARVASDHAPLGRHSRGNDPQLAVSGDRLISLWTADGDGPWGSGPLGSAVSLDGGLTWQAGPSPGTERSIGQRFPAVAGSDAAFHAVWIHAEESERSLRHARLEFTAERWSETTMIDPHICACCWNTVTIGKDGGIFVLYRDQNPSDMALAISTDKGGTWELPGPVGRFDWQFDGCPHVGGGLALGKTGSGEPLMLATVWTGETDNAGAYILRSEDAGRTWQHSPLPGEPLRGHINTDLVLSADGRATIAWDAPATNGSRAAMFATSSDHGKTWGPPERASAEGEYATHPRLVECNDQTILFWSEVRSNGETQLLMQQIATE